MPRHDFVCPTCATSLIDVVIPAAIGARAGAPTCPDCGDPTEWIPQIGAVDAKEPFQRFSITETIRGRDQTLEIGSLHGLRRIEREAEQRSRNGEGRPLVWRDYAQDRSNGDVHTLAANVADPHGVGAAARRYTDRQQARRAAALRSGSAVAAGASLQE